MRPSSPGAEAKVSSPQTLSVSVNSASTGLAVPLIEVIDQIETVWRDARLLRVDRVWSIQAQCDPREGVLAGELLQSLRAEIEAIPRPPGYQLVWEGEAGDSAEAQSSLAATLPLGFTAMVLTVILLFNAFTPFPF